MIGVFSKGIISVPHLESFLGESVVYKPSLPDTSVTAVAGWGLKETGHRARTAALRHGLPYLSLEDGFLRSLGFGVKSRPISLIVDRTGIYYNAAQPSDLENLLNTRGWEKPELLGRASSALKAIKDLRLSKYNHSPHAPEKLFSGSAAKVLVVDQTRDDMSILLGMAGRRSFERMLERARLENIDADLYVKIHPEVLAGKKTGYLGKIPRDYGAIVIDRDYSPLSVLERMDKVYAVTSQMGFEALLLGKEVRCFGLPFYAGWGLTLDEIRSERRGQLRSVEEMFAASYMLYPRYVNPYTGRQCTIEETIDILAGLRQQNEARRGLTVCCGFSKWKRPHARAFLSSSEGEVRFVKDPVRAVKKAQAGNGRIVAWASKQRNELAPLAATAGVEFVRMEDGFLRSVGLGSDFCRPFSLILDRTGIYYDPSRPSDLETIIEKGGFDARTLARAVRLRQEIVDRGITKYNVGGRAALSIPAGKPVVLIPGQVEDDASVLMGSPEIKTNLALLEAVREARPDSFIIYKPHPEVDSGNRAGSIPDDIASRFCNMIVRDTSMVALFPMIGEVHTMTSLSGFEALMRGKRVHTYGGPFYAGWGLTDDRLAFARRTRKATLDELVAAALIIYPSYYDWRTGMLCGPEVVIHRLSNGDGPQLPARRSFFRSLRRCARLLSPWI